MLYVYARGSSCFFTCSFSFALFFLTIAVHWQRTDGSLGSPSVNTISTCRPSSRQGSSTDTSHVTSSPDRPETASSLVMSHSAPWKSIVDDTEPRGSFSLPPRLPL